MFSIHTFDGRTGYDGLVAAPGRHYCAEVIGKVCTLAGHGTKPMPVARTGDGDRPHLFGDAESKCWCKPQQVECECPGHPHGTQWGHGAVMIWHDRRQRLMVFSSLSR